MGDATIDPKAIEDMRKENECLAKISEEKDVWIETLQKSAPFYWNFNNNSATKIFPPTLKKRMKFHPRNPKMANHLLHAILLNVQHLILWSASPILKEG